VDEAVWWFITMERSCQVQLLAEAAAARTGQPLKIIPERAVQQAFNILGSPRTGWFQFQTLYSKIVKEQPDLLN
jgi:ribulose-5-phosphate 4-epimerase/fuculose-1-phosphate aldolase